MNKISVATYVKKHIWSLCHLWLQRDLEKTTISTNWRCVWIFCLLVWEWTLEMIGRNYLPALIPSRAVLLHCSTSQMKWVFTRSSQLMCLNYPCSSDAEIQCQLLHVLGTGTCNNDGVQFFFSDKSRVLTLADIIALWCSTEWVEAIWHTKQLSNLFSMWGYCFKFRIFCLATWKAALQLKSSLLSMLVVGKNLPN